MCASTEGGIANANKEVKIIAEKSFFDLNYVGQKILVIIYGLFNIKDFYLIALTNEVMYLKT